MTYAFAAAGTGGHIYPALAVARTLVKTGVDAGEIVFFGGDRLETRIVPEAGFELTQLDIRGLRRALTLDNLTIPMMVRRAATEVADTLQTRPPGVLTVFGGYVSVPAALGARRVGMPYVIHEQNAVPGVANRYVARRARRTYVAFAPALGRFKGAELVGNPLAPAFERFDRSVMRGRALARYGLDSHRPVVGIVGGSLGAQALNTATVSLAAAPERSFAILHLTGADHYAAFAERSADSAHWVTEPFEQDMAMFYAASDIVLCRAGAMTVSELAATATPSIVVPLPAGKGYQALNAYDLQRAGGAIIVDQEHIATVPDRIASLVRDPGRLAAMSDGARSVARPEAAQRIATALREIIDD